MEIMFFPRRRKRSDITMRKPKQGNNKAGFIILKCYSFLGGATIFLLLLCWATLDPVVCGCLSRSDDSCHLPLLRVTYFFLNVLYCVVDIWSVYYVYSCPKTVEVLRCTVAAGSSPLLGASTTTHPMLWCHKTLAW